ncbi:MAG: cytochrome P450 [Acetobacteraceae bacterium]|nr:cytochrome P450 [Acetobacteraceae bacterium]
MDDVIARDFVPATEVQRTAVREAPRFQPELLRKQSPTSRLMQSVFGKLIDPFFALLRWAAPVLQVPWVRNGSLIWFALITRYETVREVLNNSRAFASPYGPKLQELSGSPFLLGRDDGADYRADLQLATRAFPLSDIPELGQKAENAAREIMDRTSRGIDVMAELASPVLRRVCQDYLGVATDDRDFALWAMAAAGYVLEPTGRDDTVASAQAHAAAARLCEAIDNSRARIGQGVHQTVLRRLAEIERRDPQHVDDTAIRALIFGVIIAMIPTGMLAIGHILEMLLRRPEMMNAAQQAAHAGDSEWLRRCLFEALRFKPIIPVWPRDCVRTFDLPADECRSRRIRAGTRVLVSTQSAMRDARHVREPNRFDPGRPASDYMHFGQGLHYCLGAAIASAVIPAILKPLLLRGGIAAGQGPRTLFANVFPESFPVNFSELRRP